MANLSGKRIVIAGGSGFLGLSMAEQFACAGADVKILSRTKPKADGRWSHHFWDGRTSAVCDEYSAEGIGLAPAIGRAWEATFAESKLPDQRGVIMRTSFVIGRDRGAGGGALATLGLLARIGLGGRVGSGRQGMSWIHENDLNNLFAKAITDDSMSGVYIASAPNPISQVKFMSISKKRPEYFQPFSLSNERRSCCAFRPKRLFGAMLRHFGGSF